MPFFDTTAPPQPAFSNRTSEGVESALVAALVAVPAEDLYRTWPAERTMIIRLTSRRVLEVVDKLRMPAVVRLSKIFWEEEAMNNNELLRKLEAIQARCSITRLYLPDCKMAGSDVERLVDFLAGGCQTISHLDLGGNKIGAEGAGKLARALCECPALSHLNLRSNGIGDEEVGVLGKCEALLHLDLSGNGIRADGAGRLAGVLPYLKILTHLVLRRNMIGAEGAGKLAMGLAAQCQALEHLDLGYNGIGVEGANFLALVLLECPLVHLVVDANGIGDEGASTFAGGLAKCPTLLFLNLESNRIGDKGATRLAQVLGQCPTLSDLTFRVNRIGAEGARQLTAVLGQCPAFCYLDLRENRIASTRGDVVQVMQSFMCAANGDFTVLSNTNTKQLVLEEREEEATGEKQYGCEFDCGYTGSFSDVEVHEATCPFSSLYLPASTWPNITCRMTRMMRTKAILV
jgi:Ran GTPase-activating protein 1